MSKLSTALKFEHTLLVELKHSMHGSIVPLAIFLLPFKVALPCSSDKSSQAQQAGMGDMEIGEKQFIPSEMLKITCEIYLTYIAFLHCRDR